MVLILLKRAYCFLAVTDQEDQSRILYQTETRGDQQRKDNVSDLSKRILQQSDK